MAGILATWLSRSTLYLSCLQYIVPQHSVSVVRLHSVKHSGEQALATGTARARTFWSPQRRQAVGMAAAALRRSVIMASMKNSPAL